MIPSQENHVDILRKGISYAVDAGRKMQSPITGFIHYCYQQEKNTWHTIPVVENALFALALLRTHTVDNIQEAKSILEKILAFQCGGSNFPIYLHEYPQCFHSQLPIRLLPIFHWILKYYHHVIGADLKGDLQGCQKRLLSYCIKYEKEKTLSYESRAILAGALSGYGKAFSHETFFEEGESLWKVLRREKNFKAWNTPRSLGEILTGIQMAFEDIASALGEDFIQHLGETWNRESGFFVGVPVREYHYGREHELTLYELFMCYLTKQDLGKKRMEIASPAAVMSVALVQPWKGQEIPGVSLVKESGEYEGEKWQRFVAKDFSCSTYDVLEGRLAEDGLHALRINWNGGDIVCPRGKYCVESVVYSDRVEMLFTLPKELSFDKNRHCSEIAIYCQRSDSLKFRVDGAKATTFQLGERLTIEDAKRQVAMAFYLVEGEGDFFGHLMIGNRPAQLKDRKTNSLAAYDKMVILRTVRRSRSCRIKMEIYFEGK